MSYTKVSKPGVSSYTIINPKGLEMYDEDMIYDADIEYDGTIQTYTNIAKPTGSSYTKINKPT